MNRKDFMEAYEHIVGGCRDIVIAKNRGYGQEEDAFYNLRQFGEMGVVVRISDKLHRLVNFYSDTTQNSKEGYIGGNPDDTIMDIINYLVILLAMRREEEAKNDDKNDPWGIT